MGLKSAWLRWFNLARLRQNLLALWVLWRHPNAPWPPKAVALVVLAYVLSPIDLIPDFIPILGQLDDLLLVPLGLALAIRLTPPALWQHCLAQASTGAVKLPRWAWAAAAVVLVWLLLAAWLAWWLWGQLRATP